MKCNVGSDIVDGNIRVMTQSNIVDGNVGFMQSDIVHPSSQM